ncbi:MAG: fibrillarin-like rRNA/tRNA 2'-O-methyltransferase [Methanosarcinales archaeon]
MTLITDTMLDLCIHELAPTKSAGDLQNEINPTFRAGEHDIPPLYLKKGIPIKITIKARSIDVSSNPRDVLRRELERLEERVMISHIKSLKPYHRDHYITI